jgi:hypothetical protein
MTGSWYTLKFIPDVFVNEPYNVGVVGVDGAQVEARFLAEDQDSGAISGRKLPRDLPTQTYRDWVAFIRRAAEAGDLDRRVERLARRSGDSFLIEKRGPIFGGQHLETIVDDLYSKVVTVDHGNQGDLPIHEASEKLVRSLDQPLERDVLLQVRDQREVEHSLKFPYRYSGSGTTTLLDRISIGDRESPFVDSLLFRIGLAERSKKADDFIVFYRMASDSQHVEETLRRVEAYANTLNVAEPTAAADLATQLGVGLLDEGVSAIV